ncbi:hypothetical protein KJ781_00045 [Patescibacteria group bacterium]|nr:hypothetical protein [Patescibacteria group bacterium]MBU1448389.1 hypothetical protein [Patescibacteria group bacterium]MBU2613237.1 hypothetical protein [Patescibacteria group bacterium]
MGIDFEKLGWGASTEQETVSSDSCHFRSMHKALERVGGGHVPHAAVEEMAVKVAPEAEVLKTSGERRTTKVVKAVLKGMMSHLPTYAMPTKDNGREWELHALEAIHEGSDKGGNV